MLLFYSLRVMLNEPVAESPVSAPQSELMAVGASRCLVQKVMKDGLRKLEGSPATTEKCIRWELGSCWVQHLQKQETTDKDSESQKDDTKVEPAVRGLGKQFKMLKKREKTTPGATERDNDGIPNMESSIDEMKISESNSELLKFVSEEAILRLKETGVGLHDKVLNLRHFLCM